MISRKIRKALTINQSNDCKCNGCSRSRQQSRYNKFAKRNSSRLARRLDEQEIKSYDD